MKTLFLTLIICLLAGVTFGQAQGNDRPAGTYKGASDAEQAVFDDSVDAYRIMIVDSLGNKIASLPVTISGASASGGGLTVTLSNLSVGYDSSLSAWAGLVQNPEWAHYTDYEQLASLTDTSMQYSSIINGYRNFAIHVDSLLNITSYKVYITGNPNVNLSTINLSEWVDASTAILGGATASAEGMYFAVDYPVYAVLLKAVNGAGASQIRAWIKKF